MLVDRLRMPDGFDLSDEGRALILGRISEIWHTANTLISLKHEYYRKKYPQKRWPRKSLEKPDSVEFFYPENTYEYNLGALCVSHRKSGNRLGFTLYFNVTYINRDFDYFISEIVPHEIAHAFIEYFYRDKHPITGHRLSDHNSYWKSLAERLSHRTIGAYMPYEFKPIAPRNWKAAIKKKSHTSK